MRAPTSQREYRGMLDSKWESPNLRSDDLDDDVGRLSWFHQAPARNHEIPREALPSLDSSQSKLVLRISPSPSPCLEAQVVLSGSNLDSTMGGSTLRCLSQNVAKDMFEKEPYRRTSKRQGGTSHHGARRSVSSNGQPIREEEDRHAVTADADLGSPSLAATLSTRSSLQLEHSDSDSLRVRRRAAALEGDLLESLRLLDKARVDRTRESELAQEARRNLTDEQNRRKLAERKFRQAEAEQEREQQGRHVAERDRRFLTRSVSRLRTRLQSVTRESQGLRAEVERLGQKTNRHDVCKLKKDLEDAIGALRATEKDLAASKANAARTSLQMSQLTRSISSLQSKLSQATLERDEALTRAQRADDEFESHETKAKMWEEEAQWHRKRNQSLEKDARGRERRICELASQLEAGRSRKPQAVTADIEISGGPSPKTRIRAVSPSFRLTTTC